VKADFVIGSRSMLLRGDSRKKRRGALISAGARPAAAPARNTRDTSSAYRA